MKWLCEKCGAINHSGAAQCHCCATADESGQENFTKDSSSKEIFTKNSNDLVFRLRKRAEIRRNIQSRKSVQDGAPDRIADLLEEAANHIAECEAEIEKLKKMYSRCGLILSDRTAELEEMENIVDKLEIKDGSCAQTAAGVMGYPSEADERVKRLWAKLDEKDKRIDAVRSAWAAVEAWIKIDGLVNADHPLIVMRKAVLDLDPVAANETWNDYEHKP